MHLMYYLNESGARVYTMKVSPHPLCGPLHGNRATLLTSARLCLCRKRRRTADQPSQPTQVRGAPFAAVCLQRFRVLAPCLPPPRLRAALSRRSAARFSPDDKFSKHRLICKKRFGLLPTQRPKVEL